MNCPADLLMIRYSGNIMAPSIMSYNRNQVTILFCSQAQMTLRISMAGLKFAKLETLASLLLNHGTRNVMMCVTTLTLTAYIQLPHKHLLASRYPNRLS